MQITDEFMRAMVSKAKGYTVVILKNTPKRNEPGADKIVWEHARRNFALRDEGVLPIVGPIRDGSEISGIGIFNADVETTRRLMEEDPGVKAGIFQYEVHPTFSFAGDSLPG